jgi:predicted RND superfamily exporter protein
MMGHLGRRNTEAMVPGMVLAVVLISVTVLIALRSAKLGVLSFFTILLPSVVTFGLWGMIDGNIGVMAASVVAIALGIVVDSNVHFFSKYQRARQEQALPTSEAVLYAFRTVGVAIGVNSLILALGFALLAESWIKPNQDMGILTAIAIVYSLLQTYLLLPILLLIFDREPSHAS